MIGATTEYLEAIEANGDLAVVSTNCFIDAGNFVGQSVELPVVVTKVQGYRVEVTDENGNIYIVHPKRLYI